MIDSTDMSELGLRSLEGGISRSYLTDSVYQKLLEGIISGILRPGTELVSATVSAQLGVSRTPVVEALRRLQNDGLLYSESNRTPRVACFGIADIEEVYEMRVTLEATAAERAATRIGAAELAELRRKGDELAAAPDDDEWPTLALEYDIEFHANVASAAANSRLEADINRYRLLVRGFCRITGHHLREALAEHLEILRAFEAGDPITARDAMVRHIRLRLAAVVEEVQKEPVGDRRLGMK